MQKFLSIVVKETLVWERLKKEGRVSFLKEDRVGR